MNISLEQINLMKHAIGFTSKKIKRGKYIVWRNYFCSYGKSRDWEQLVELGFAKKNQREEAIYYFVTEKGMDYIGKIVGAKIIEYIYRKRTA